MSENTPLPSDESSLFHQPQDSCLFSEKKKHLSIHLLIEILLSSNNR